MKKIKKKTPSRRIVFKFKKEKTATARCGNCGRILHGVPKGRNIEMKILSKSERRPERPYGGYLCSECMRDLFRERARNEYG